MKLLITDFSGGLNPAEIRPLMDLVPNLIITDTRPYTVTVEINNADEARIREWVGFNRSSWILGVAGHGVRIATTTPFRALGSDELGRSR